MTTGQIRFRVNSADVVHEVVDGEVIAIDLGRGSYYNLAGSAVQVWAMLEGGTSAEEVLAAFDSAGGNGDDVAGQLHALLDRLAAESLIVPDEGGEGAAPRVAEGLTFEPPRFEKYDDMQDYFLLDPIHEVDATGWPNRQPG